MKLRCDQCGSRDIFAISPGAEPSNVVMISATKAERARLRRGRPARELCLACWLRKHKSGKASA